MSNKETYTLQGKVKVINDTQTFDSGFQKREFVVTTDGEWPQDVKFEVIKDKCNVLDGFSTGQEVIVHFDVRGNEYNGKYYVNLSAWRIDAVGQVSNTAAATVTPQATPTPTPTPTPHAAGATLETDDIPFNKVSSYEGML